MTRSEIFNLCNEAVGTGEMQSINYGSKGKLTNARIYLSQYNKNKDKKVSSRVVGNELVLYCK
jgi:hypothetical protein